MARLAVAVLLAGILSAAAGDADAQVTVSIAPPNAPVSVTLNTEGNLGTLFFNTPQTDGAVTFTVFRVTSGGNAPLVTMTIQSVEHCSLVAPYCPALHFRGWFADWPERVFLSMIFASGGATVTATAAGGGNAAHYAAAANNTAAMAMMLSMSPVAITLTDDGGRTPFHSAAMGGAAQMMTLLHSVNVSLLTMTTNDGSTPADLVNTPAALQAVLSLGGTCERTDKCGAGVFISVRGDGEFRLQPRVSVNNGVTSHYLSGNTAAQVSFADNVSTTIRVEGPAAVMLPFAAGDVSAYHNARLSADDNGVIRFNALSLNANATFIANRAYTVTNTVYANSGNSAVATFTVSATMIPPLPRVGLVSVAAGVAGEVAVVARYAPEGDGYFCAHCLPKSASLTAGVYLTRRLTASSAAGGTLNFYSKAPRPGVHTARVSVGVGGGRYYGAARGFDIVFTVGVADAGGASVILIGGRPWENDTNDNNLRHVGMLNANGTGDVARIGRLPVDFAAGFQAAAVNDTIVVIGVNRNNSGERVLLVSRGGRQWQRAPFPLPAPDMALAAHKGEFYAVGGNIPGGNVDLRVWKSADGVSWRQVVRSGAGFPHGNLTGHRLISFDGKLITFDNDRDIIYSENDGATWSQTDDVGIVNFTPPNGYDLRDHNGTLVLFGIKGAPGDVYYSAGADITSWAKCAHTIRPILAHAINRGYVRGVSHNGTLLVFNTYTGADLPIVGGTCPAQTETKLSGINALPQFLAEAVLIENDSRSYYGEDIPPPPPLITVMRAAYNTSLRAGTHELPLAQNNTLSVEYDSSLFTAAFSEDGKAASVWLVAPPSEYDAQPTLATIVYYAQPAGIAVATNYADITFPPPFSLSAAAIPGGEIVVTNGVTPARELHRFAAVDDGGNERLPYTFSILAAFHGITVVTNTADPREGIVSLTEPTTMAGGLHTLNIRVADNASALTLTLSVTIAVAGSDHDGVFTLTAGVAGRVRAVAIYSGSPQIGQCYRCLPSANHNFTAGIAAGGILSVAAGQLNNNANSRGLTLLSRTNWPGVYTSTVTVGVSPAGAYTPKTMTITFTVAPPEAGASVFLLSGRRWWSDGNWQQVHVANAASLSQSGNQFAFVQNLPGNPSFGNGNNGYFKVAALNGTIVVIGKNGSADYMAVSDETGRNFTMVSPFPLAASDAALAAHNGAFYAVGGNTQASETGNQYSAANLARRVWRSYDGLNWAPVTANTINEHFSRNNADGHDAISHNGTLFTYVKPATNENRPQKIDIVYSTDGENWTQVKNIGNNGFPYIDNLGAGQRYDLLVHRGYVMVIAAIDFRRTVFHGWTTTEPPQSRWRRCDDGGGNLNQYLIPAGAVSDSLMRIGMRAISHNNSLYIFGGGNARIMAIPHKCPRANNNNFGANHPGGRHTDVFPILIENTDRPYYTDELPRQ